MIRLLLGFIFLSIANEGFSQEASPTAAYSCKEIMRQLSKEWKEDSTGNGGFRRANAKYILACKQPNLTKDYLLQTLGKPNEVREVYKGFQLLYYYYDARTMPKGQEGILACLSVSFNFREGETTVFSITDDDTDL